MAGRVKSHEQEAMFRPYPNASGAQKSETTKVAGKDDNKSTPPTGKDTADSSGSGHATSTKKKKKSKKKSPVGYQFLFELKIS
jgi:hypothetical protein